MGENVMEDIVKTEEGQRLFDFLDRNWGMIRALYEKNYLRSGGWNGTMEAVNRAIDIEGELFDFDLLEEKEFNNIVQYFLNMGSSY